MGTKKYRYPRQRQRKRQSVSSTRRGGDGSDETPTQTPVDPPKPTTEIESPPPTALVSEPVVAVAPEQQQEIRSEQTPTPAPTSTPTPAIAEQSQQPQDIPTDFSPENVPQPAQPLTEPFVEDVMPQNREQSQQLPDELPDDLLATATTNDTDQQLQQDIDTQRTRIDKVETQIEELQKKLLRPGLGSHEKQQTESSLSLLQKDAVSMKSRFQKALQSAQSSLFSSGSKSSPTAQLQQSVQPAVVVPQQSTMTETAHTDTPSSHQPTMTQPSQPLAPTQPSAAQTAPQTIQDKLHRASGPLSPELTVEAMDTILREDKTTSLDEANLRFFLKHADKTAVQAHARNFELMFKLWALHSKSKNDLNAQILYFIRDYNCFIAYFANKVQLIDNQITIRQQSTQSVITDKDVFNKNIQSDIIVSLNKEKIYYEQLGQRALLVSSVQDMSTAFVVEDLFKPYPNDDGGVVLTNKDETKLLIKQLTSNKDKAKVFALFSYFVQMVQENKDDEDAREIVVFMRKQILRHNLVHIKDKRKKALTPNDTTTLMTILQLARASLSKSVNTVDDGSKSLLSKFSTFFRNGDGSSFSYNQEDFDRLVELTAYLDTATYSIDEFEDAIRAKHKPLFDALKRRSRASKKNRRSSRSSEELVCKSNYTYAQDYINQQLDTMRQLMLANAIEWQDIVSREYKEGHEWETIKTLRVIHDTLDNLDTQSLNEAIARTKDEQLKQQRLSRRHSTKRRSERYKKDTEQFLDKLDETQESEELIGKYRAIIEQLQAQMKVVGKEMEEKESTVQAEIDKRKIFRGKLRPHHIESFRRWRNLQTRKLNDIDIDIESTNKRIEFESRQQYEFVQERLRDPLFGYYEHGTSYREYAKSDYVNHGEVLWDAFLGEDNSFNGNSRLQDIRIKTDIAILDVRKERLSKKIYIVQPSKQKKQLLQIKIAGYKESRNDSDNWYFIIILESYKKSGMLGKKRDDDLRFYISILESRTDPEHKGGKNTIYSYFISDKDKINGIDLKTLNAAIKEDAIKSFSKPRRSRRRFSKKNTFSSNKNSIRKDFSTYEGVQYILNELMKLQMKGENVLVNVKPYPKTTVATKSIVRHSRRINRRLSNRFSTRNSDMMSYDNDMNMYGNDLLNPPADMIEM